ncbi:hypothetical protein GC170_14540 [bacterium]|nr:hypothetical protein [bacterium]
MAGNYNIKDADGDPITIRAIELAGGTKSNVVHVYSGSDIVSSGNPLPVAQTGSIPAGSNLIGNVGLAAGSAAIGTVVVTSLPNVTLGAGSAVVGKFGIQVGGSDVGTTNPVNTAGRVIRPASNSLTIATLSGGTPYSLGDIIANSATAGSVTPFSWDVGRSSGFIRRIMLTCSRTSLPATLPTFRIHLWTAQPTFASGDNAAFSASGVSSYLGAWDVTLNRAFTDGCVGIGGYPNDGSEQNFVIPSGTTIYGALTLSPSAAGTYTPNHASIAEIFVAYPEVHLF